MPTYEYRCRSCGVRFERFQRISADPITDCPECGEKGSVERLISGGAGLIFKGSGFYATDYRSESYKQAAKKDKEAANSSASSSGTTSSDSGSKGGATNGSSTQTS